MYIALTLLGLVVLLAIVAVSVYNGLVTHRNRYRNAFAQVDVQLKRRYDLIPNLVETAKGYLKHEREVLEAVTAARGAAAAASARAAEAPGDPAAMRALTGAEQALAGVMGRLLAVVEAYPDLKANQTMASLMEELTSTENRVAFARQAYNDAVMAYNIAREKFPGALIAGPAGFGPAQLLEVIGSPGERDAPKVRFA